VAGSRLIAYEHQDSSATLNGTSSLPSASIMIAATVPLRHSDQFSHGRALASIHRLISFLRVRLIDLDNWLSAREDAV
jgi:hypothetical protein